MQHNLIGGKGGSSGSFKSLPDTLRSNDSFEMLLGLGAGRWKGLKNGLRSLDINDVPLENEDGSSNFQDFAVIFADGDPAQTQRINFKLGGGGGTTQVNQQIGNVNTGVPGPWVTAATSTVGADFIDLRLVIQQLYYQDNKGIKGNTMTLELQMRPRGSANWINPLSSNAAPTYDAKNGFAINDGFDGSLRGYMLAKAWANTNTWNDPNPGYIVINDKTTSPAVKELRIAVPNTGDYANKSWEVRIRLIEKDTNQADPVDEKRTVTFESIAAVIKRTIGETEPWRGLAWLQIVGKATQQLSGVPAIRGVYETKIVKTPPSSVFNPESRQYTTNLWDGSYTLNYTADPAWCIADIIEDPISGIAALSPGASLDKWDALEASKYYSELVSDGKGGLHPRFSMNVNLDQVQNTNDLMQYLAGAVNSLAVDTGDSKWRLKVDKPENPVAIFTRDNIVGEFQYSHTDVDSRFNDYTVSFTNAENRYQEDRVRVFDQAHIDRFGRKPTTIVAVGCNNRQEAMRRAMFRLRVSTNEHRLVNFTTNRQGGLIQPLNVIMVADTDLAYTGSTVNSLTTTRIKNINGTTITLGAPLRLETGVSYKLKITVPNPDYDPDRTSQPTNPDWKKPTIVVTRTVTNTASQRGDVTVLYLDTALPANAPVEAPVALEATGLPSLPIAYRVMEVSPGEDGETYSIQALVIDSGKWFAMDNVSEAALMGQVADQTVAPPGIPADGLFSVRSFETDFQIKRVLTINWDRPPSLFLEGVRVEYNLNGGPWIILDQSAQQNYIEIQQPENGIYTVRLTAKDRRGRESSAVTASYNVDENASDYSNLQRVGKLADLPSRGRAFGERYTTDDQNPNVTFIWDGTKWVAESNFVDKADQIQFEGGETLEEMKPAEGGATVGGTIGDNIRNPDGTLYIPLTPEQLRDTTPPAKVQNLVLDSVLTDRGATITGSWDAPTDTDLAGYDFEIKEGTSQYFSYSTNLPKYQINDVRRNTTFTARVRAYDTSGNRGEWSDVKTKVTARDDVAPAAPTNFKISAAFETFFLSWTSPSDADMDIIEIYAGATNDVTKATLIGASRVTPSVAATYTRAGLARPFTAFHWIRAVDTSGNRSGFTGPVSATTTTVDISDLTPGLNLVKEVSTLPDPTNYTGAKLVFNTTDRRFYRYQNGKWNGNVVDVADLQGKLSGDQIGENTISGENLVPETITSDLFEKNVRIPGNIVDINDKLIFGLDGFITPDATTTVNGNTVKLSTIAQNSLVPSLNYVGEFATAPSQAQLGDRWKQNAVYKNSTDMRSYVLTGSPLDWVIYLSDGVAFNVEIESSNGTVFRVGQSRTTMLKARLFKNGAEVTEQAPESWFSWRRISVIPRQPPNDDASWNAKYKTGYKQIQINVDDVQSQATFFVDIIN